MTAAFVPAKETASLLHYIAHPTLLWIKNSRYDRLRNQGLLTLAEMAKLLGTSKDQVKIWRRHGFVRGHAHNDKNGCLFEHPVTTRPARRKVLNFLAAVWFE